MIKAVKYELNFSCISCADVSLQLVEGYETLPRVTSDCRMFGPGGFLAVCQTCSLVQKIPDQQWRKDIIKIYNEYVAYEIAEGHEQLVFDPRSGSLRKRSEVLINELIELKMFPEKLRLLDVGCGHGVTLSAMAKLFPNWQLFGHELSDTNKAQIESIENLEMLYTGKLAEIDRDFGLISMVHSLEHFTEPLNTLRTLHSLIENNGHLFVEVCNLEENPFDILVADHLTHFAPATLASMAARAGFEVLFVQTSWVKKELSMLARRSSLQKNLTLQPEDGEKVLATMTNKVQWLKKILSNAREAADMHPLFGIFGTSIAGTWLGSTLKDKVSFFVDEDPDRIGREFMGKPILGPDEIPGGAVVYLALAPVLAKVVFQRLADANSNVRFLQPN
jgi:2-polyprenyl-3-methyl-5-hydroxy-6-metoxy-1,4-benzoquinol methylase